MGGAVDYEALWAPIALSQNEQGRLETCNICLAAATDKNYSRISVDPKFEVYTTRRWWFEVFLPLKCSRTQLL